MIFGFTQKLKKYNLFDIKILLPLLRLSIESVL